MSKLVWNKKGFEEFSKGTFGNGGQNLYVSAAGVLQRIHQYDITGNGYPDLIFSNSQSMGERPPIFVYDAMPSGECETKLRNRGTFDGIMADLTGDGKQDLIVACQHDGVTSDVTSMIYFSSPEGYTEKYMTELPAPGSVSVAAGDFRGIGKKDLAFAGKSRIRLFEQTELGIEAPCFKDFEINAISICADDLDGDGFDDLYTLTKEGRLRIYWGACDGINPERYTELDAKVDVGEEMSTSTPGRVSLAYLPWTTSVVNVYGKKCIFRYDGENAVFESFTAERKPDEKLRVKIKGAVHAASGEIFAKGNSDIVIAVCSDREKTEYSLAFPEHEDYSADKALKFETQSAHTVTVSPLEKDGKSYVFFAGSGCRNTNETYNRIYSIEADAAKLEKEVKGCCTTRILAGDTGKQENYQCVFLNHEGGSPSGVENIFIYTGDKDGYSPDRKIELPGLSAVEGQMIDFTDNGNPDVIVVCCAENCPNLCTGLYIYHNDGNGPDINKREDVGAILPHGIAVGDFRHSGYLDIAVGGIHNREMRIYEGGPDGYSDERMKKIVLGPNPESFVPFHWKVEDLDVQAYPDEELDNIREFGEFRWMFTADLNGDGYLDLIVPQIVGKHSYIFWGGPDGFSLDNMQILATDGAGCANVADLNGNGYPDLVLGGHVSLGKVEMRESYITIYWNGPEGLSENRKTCLPAWCANSLAIADFNGDGVLDIFATSYSNSRVRDLDSYIYYGDLKKGFSVDRRDRIFNNSGCGCIAGDFNGDGYVDLAVGSHKKEGNHVCESFVYWGGPDGIDENRKTVLPTVGVHGMTTVDIGNIMDRSDDEYYYSEIFEIPDGRTAKKVFWEAENEISTSVHMQLRCSDIENEISHCQWSREYECDEFLDKDKLCGKFIQYRLILRAKSGCGTPRVKSVSVEFDN
ncbi:MAG: VCBS repeat-containing protein [Clostridia bacterium]|nr:VCBS repeat-containing protein [Clostridia bacterium]